MNKAITLLMDILYKKPSGSRGSEASLYNKEESKLFYSSEGGYADRKVAPFQDPGDYYVTLLAQERQGFVFVSPKKAKKT